jgi:hypothetical protein
MLEPLTNAILASILHFIQRDHTRNRRAPPRQAHARRCHRHPHRSGPRAVTPPPSYQPMGPSPPRLIRPPLLGTPLPPFGAPYNPITQVDLGRLAGPPEGITPFTVAGPRRTPAIEEERGQPAVEPQIWGTTDLTISDWLATPYHIVDPPSPTPDTANPNPNGSGSGSPPRISPLDIWVIHRVIRLPISI